MGENSAQANCTTLKANLTGSQLLLQAGNEL